MSDSVFPYEQADPLPRDHYVYALRFAKRRQTWVYREICLIPHQPLHVEDFLAENRRHFGDVGSQASK